MNEEVDLMLDNPYLHTLSYFSVAVIALVVFMIIFNFITHYNDWEEIKKGNLAVAMATGGKIFGICNIFRFAIAHKDPILDSVVWASYGFGLLLVAYYLFDVLTPYFKTEQEIKNGNQAVGFISMIISVSLSFVIGASVG
jgi:putative membrane protein